MSSKTKAIVISLARRGAPLHAIRDLLGHSTIEMTLRYAHLAPDALRDAISLLERPPVESTATWRQPEDISNGYPQLSASFA